MNIDYEVHRNDKISPEEALSFDVIILSPGPGIPSEAGMFRSSGDCRIFRCKTK
jgi:anthranilate synthase component 2